MIHSSTDEGRSSQASPLSGRDGMGEERNLVKYNWQTEACKTDGMLI